MLSVRGLPYFKGVVNFPLGASQGSFGRSRRRGDGGGVSPLS